jgi:hypothetical protein
MTEDTREGDSEAQKPAQPFEVIARPNGKSYRPRGIRCRRWENDGYGNEDGCGVVALGTHDMELAAELAEGGCQHWYNLHAAKPEVGWWRLGYSYGELRWFDDPERGAAGVIFTAVELDEVSA